MMDYQPPTVIKVKNFAPLQLAKKKHYIAIDEPLFKITKTKQRRSSSSSSASSDSSLSCPKSQGRPFNESLNARFLFFYTIDNMISELFNHKVQALTLITKLDSFKSSGSSFNNTMQLQIRPDSNVCKMKQLVFGKNYETEDSEDEEVTNIGSELCKAFNTEELSFVKIIRDNKGKLVKFEILSDLKNEDLSINFIKKFITYPRYKANMKIHLIRGKFDKNIWFYNDMRMLLWDLEHVYLGHVKLLINNNILDS